MFKMVLLVKVIPFYFVETFRICIIPNTIHTERTKGAVSVVKPAFIPAICSKTDNKIAIVAHPALCQLFLPSAIPHKTPLYPNKPAFNT